MNFVLYSKLKNNKSGFDLVFFYLNITLFEKDENDSVDYMSDTLKFFNLA